MDTFFINLNRFMVWGTPLMMFLSLLYPYVPIVSFSFLMCLVPATLAFIYLIGMIVFIFVYGLMHQDTIKFLMMMEEFEEKSKTPAFRKYANPFNIAKGLRNGEWD